MSVCWYCHWGWSKPVTDIYKEAVRKLGGNSNPLSFGPAHIVWEDENFDSAQWCLDHFDDYAENLTAFEREVVRWSLEELNALPMDEKCVEPKDYDGEHPENYPPHGVVMGSWDN